MTLRCHEMSQTHRLDRLRAALLAFRAADAVESGHRHKMLALTAVEGDPFTRSHLVPGHFTASAFLLSPDEKAVLLILHRKLRRWLQPGGHIERHDADILAAARRELLEEASVAKADPIGLEPFDVDVHQIPALGSEPSHHHFDVRVLLRARSWAIRAGAEVEDARWVPLNAIEEVGTDESVLRATRKLVARG